MYATSSVFLNCERNSVLLRFFFLHFFVYPDDRGVMRLALKIAYFKIIRFTHLMGNVIFFSIHLIILYIVIFVKYLLTNTIVILIIFYIVAIISKK